MTETLPSTLLTIHLMSLHSYTEKWLMYCITSIQLLLETAETISSNHISKKVLHVFFCNNGSDSTYLHLSIHQTKKVVVYVMYVTTLHIYIIFTSNQKSSRLCMSLITYVDKNLHCICNWKLNTFFVNACVREIDLLASLSGPRGRYSTKQRQILCYQQFERAYFISLK